jgi:hypothetical protein
MQSITLGSREMYVLLNEIHYENNGENVEEYALYCIVLYCIVLYCIVLYCIVLYCIVLYCILFTQYDL